MTHFKQEQQNNNYLFHYRPFNLLSRDKQARQKNFVKCFDRTFFNNNNGDVTVAKRNARIKVSVFSFPISKIRFQRYFCCRPRATAQSAVRRKIFSNRAYFIYCIAKSIHIKGFYRQFCRSSLYQDLRFRLASSDPAGSILACWFFVILFVFFQAFFPSILLLGSELLFGHGLENKKKKEKQKKIFLLHV